MWDKYFKGVILQKNLQIEVLEVRLVTWGTSLQVKLWSGPKTVLYICTYMDGNDNKVPLNLDGINRSIFSDFSKNLRRHSIIVFTGEIVSHDK